MSQHNPGDVITQSLHCPGSHFDISLLRSASAHASRRPLAVVRLWKDVIVSFFCEISHWAGPNQLFLLFVCCQEDYFCIQYVKMFLFLLTIIKGFNLWKIKTKKQRKKLKKRWDQIKCNTPEMPVNLFFSIKEMMPQNGFTFNPLSFSRLSHKRKKNPVPSTVDWL